MSAIKFFKGRGIFFQAAAGVAIGGLLVASTAFGWNDPTQGPSIEQPLLSAPASEPHRGNVGIATGSPSSTTTIAGNFTVGTGLGFINSILAANSAAFEGNLGIGTSAPGAKLDVANGGITIGDILSIGSWNSRVPTKNQANSLSGQGGRVVSMSVGSDGLPIFTYYGDSSTFNFVKCHTITCDQLDVQLIDSSANAGNSNAIAIGSDGFPIIGYNYVADGVIGVKFAKCNNISCSDSEVTQIDEYGLNPSVVVRSDGFPLFIYYQRIQGSNGDLRARRCANDVCTSVLGSDIVLATSAIIGSSLQFTISSSIGYDGNPVIAYYHNGGGSTNDLKFIKCTEFDCSTFIPGRDIGPTAGQAGIYNAITVGTDGLPFITMTSGSPAISTRAIKCTTPDCVSSIETDIGIGISWQAVAMAPDGLPSAINFGNGINFVKCFNSTCSKYMVTTPVTDVEGPGGISLAFGADGLPLIGYKDTTGVPTIFRCGNPLCLNYWTQR